MAEAFSALANPTAGVVKRSTGPRATWSTLRLRPGIRETAWPRTRTTMVVELVPLVSTVGESRNPSPVVLAYPRAVLLAWLGLEPWARAVRTPSWAEARAMLRAWYHSAAMMVSSSARRTTGRARVYYWEGLQWTVM